MMSSLKQPPERTHRRHGLTPPERLLASLTAAALFLPLSAKAETDAVTSADSDDGVEVPEQFQDVEVVEVMGRQETLTEVPTRRLLKVPGAGNDPLQAIESLPGVVFSSGRESEPAVRGSAPEDNAYYIDFFPVGYIFHSDSSSILNDNVVEGFKLESAAFGPEYNGATGAIIDASSRSPDFGGDGQTVLDLSLLKAGIFIERSLGDNQAFYLSGRQSLFQYYIENFLGDEEFEFTTVPEYYDYQGKYEYQISTSESIVVQAIGARDKVGLEFDEDSDELAQDPGLEGGLKFENYFNSQGILWNKVYNSGMTQKIGFSQLEQKLLFGLGSNSRIDVKVNDYRIRSQFSYALNLDHELHWGLEAGATQIGFKGQYAGPPCDDFDPDCRLVDGQETITGTDKLTISSYGLHVADRWQTSDTVTLTPGLLISEEDYTNELFIEPKLQARWEFDTWWALTGGYGQYHDFPDDNFGQYARYYGNPDLKVSRATHYELGLEHELREDILISFETYYKTMDKLVIAREDKDTVYPTLTDEEYLALPRYTNDADGNSWGFELFINKDLVDSWYGWLSIAYSRTQRTNQLTGEDFRYSYDQPVIINAVANYQLNDNWQIGAKWRYQSGQLVTPLEGAEQDPNNPELYNPIYGELNSERLPAYHKLDVRADRTYYYTGWEMDLYVEMLNVYARENVVDYEYKNADYSEREDVTDLPPILSVGVKLKL